MELTITRAAELKDKPKDESELGFGRIFTDHMLTIAYTEGTGWHDAKIVPYGPLSMDPSAMVLHYGQTIFEGMKAYYGPGGETRLFRPLDNFRRLNHSADRLCIPNIDVDFALNALCELIRLDRGWIPQSAGTSLYIRPFIIATDPYVGVKSSSTYLFMIILSPVGAYYASGLNPVRIYVEDEFVRAVKGGMGFAKTAGNYAASLKAGEIAREKGYAQVLWLDGVHKKYVDEVGSMNIFFKIGGEIITPPLNGSILAGITRDSIIKLAKRHGYPVSERPVTIQEVYDASENGTLDEVFGTGTAAVISPVGGLCWNNRQITVNGGKMGKASEQFYNELTGIQYGTAKDGFGWTMVVD